MAVHRSPVLVSWVYAFEDEPIARELLRLARVLEKQGLVRNQMVTQLPGGLPATLAMPLGGARSAESVTTQMHDFARGIAAFLVSPASLKDAHWRRLLASALLDRRTRTILVLVSPVSDPDFAKQVRHLVVLPTSAPLATRRDREDGLLEVIQAVQEMAEFRQAIAPEVTPRLRASNTLSINDIFRLNGPPTVTFVEPPRFRELQLELETMGAGLIVEGPSKTGKSTAIRKAMEVIGGEARNQLWWAGQTPRRSTSSSARSTSCVTPISSAGCSSTIFTTWRTSATSERSRSR